MWWEARLNSIKSENKFFVFFINIAWHGMQHNYNTNYCVEYKWIKSITKDWWRFLPLCTVFIKANLCVLCLKWFSIFHLCFSINFVERLTMLHLATKKSSSVCVRCLNFKFSWKASKTVILLKNFVIRKMLYFVIWVIKTTVRILASFFGNLFLESLHQRSVHCLVNMKENQTIFHVTYERMDKMFKLIKL